MSSNNDLQINFSLVMNDKGVITGIKNINGEIIKIPNVMKDAEKAIKNGTEKMKSCFSLTTIAGMGLLQATKQLASFISSSFQKAKHFESLQMSMEVLLGTAEKAFENSAGTTDNMIQTIHNNLNDIKETLVTNLLPAINAIVGVVKSILQVFGNMPLVLY
jgi:hypothetical protein